MESKKIIITGSATRIGAAIARSLAGRDIQITLHYNKSMRAVKDLRKELESLGTKVFLIKVDLSIMSETKKIIPFAYKMMKGLDCLINNASVFEIIPSGMGLVFVLSILLSISSSNHILIAADDPAPKLIDSNT